MIKLSWGSALPLFHRSPLRYFSKMKGKKIQVSDGWFTGRTFELSASAIHQIFCASRTGKRLHRRYSLTQEQREISSHSALHIIVAFGRDYCVVQKEFFYSFLAFRELTDEIIQTMFRLVEQSFNSCPLTAVTCDANNLEALKPNHFLLGQSSVSFSPLTFDEDFANAIWTTIIYGN